MSPTPISAGASKRASQSTAGQDTMATQDSLCESESHMVCWLRQEYGTRRGRATTKMAV